MLKCPNCEKEVKTVVEERDGEKRLVCYDCRTFITDRISDDPEQVEEK